MLIKCYALTCRPLSRQNNLKFPNNFSRVLLFHNLYVERVYHTTNFGFRMWKNYTVIILPMPVLLWEYFTIVLLLQNIVYYFYWRIFFIATIIIIYPQKIVETVWVSNVFRRNRKKQWTWPGLRSTDFYSTWNNTIKHILEIHVMQILPISKRFNRV